MHRSNRLLAIVAGASVLAASAACAQSHEASGDGYTLRSSTVSSESVAGSAPRAHGIEQDPAVGILNVTVLRKGQPGNGTVAAAIGATVRDLVGRSRPIGMTQDRENGFVSYYGTYRRLAGERLDFLITAFPEGTAVKLRLHCRDRVAPR